MDGRMVIRDELNLANDVVIAEAAAWLARLQGPGRTAAAEAAFKEWLEADPSHARAFGAATNVWEVLPAAATRARAKEIAASNPWRAPHRWQLAAVVASLTVLIVLAAGVTLNLQPATYTTAVGERRTLPLKDGSHVTLNTASSVMVEYTAASRLVRLQRGEALFEVAKDASRPFIVEAREKRVTALGTSFVVRLDDGRVSVTLLEGKVEVLQSSALHERARPAVLTPGERLVIEDNVHASTVVATLDRPRIEAVTAWQRGELMFDDVSLIDAVAEFNRYADVQVKVAGPVAGFRVSGVFTTRSPAEFADALAQLHGLKVDRKEGSIVMKP
jgi:transmembrane sensor